MQSVVQSYDTSVRKELATKADLLETKHELVKWFIGALLAHAALIVGIMAFIQ